MKPLWDEGFFPPEVWYTMTNLGLLVAFVALLSALGYLWHNGPALLIKYGPKWFTDLGNKWETKRT